METVFVWLIILASLFSIGFILYDEEVIKPVEDEFKIH